MRGQKARQWDWKKLSTLLWKFQCASSKEQDQ
jgi:hypothetical protein